MVKIVATDVVLPLNANTPAGAVYDTTGMTLTKDSAGNSYLVQDPSMLATPSQTVQNLIQQSTGGDNSPYSWGALSPTPSSSDSTSANFTQGGCTKPSTDNTVSRLPLAGGRMTSD